MTGSRRMHRRHERTGPVLATALVLALTGTLPVGAAEEWHRLDYGGVAFETPTNLHPFDGGGPGPLTAETKDWNGVALTASRNGNVESSLLLVVGWGESAHAYSESDGVVSKSVAIRLGERPAVRIDFTVKDTYNDTRGIDVVVADPPLFGRRFVLTCRGPSAKWKTLKPICDRIAASLTVNEPSETGPAIADTTTGRPDQSPPAPATPTTTPPSPPSEPTAAPGPSITHPTEAATAVPTPQPATDPATTAVSTNGRRIALVIGNGAYLAAPKLATPANDADRMTAKLKGLGFEVIAGIDLARPPMTSDLAAFYARAQGAEVALFYFSGHGIQVKGHNYLLPIDADFAAPGAAFDVEARAIDLQKFLDAAGGAKVLLAFIDACRDNPVVEEKLASTFYKGIGGATKGLAVLPKEAVRPNQFVVFASEEGKTAQTGTGTVSVFTEALLDHLGAPGEDISVAYRKIRAEVERLTGGQQSPRSVDDLRGEMVLAPRR